jgi:hypothetical protein
MEQFGTPGSRQVLFPPEYKTGDRLTCAGAR